MRSPASHSRQIAAFAPGDPSAIRGRSRGSDLADAADCGDHPGGDQVRGGVDDRDPAQSNPRRDKPAERRADQAAEVVVQCVKGIGRYQLLLADQQGQERVLGRAEKLADRRHDCGDDIDDPDAIGGVDHKQRATGRAPDEVGDHHRPLAVPAVDEDAGDRAEEQRGDLVRDQNRAGGEG